MQEQSWREYKLLVMSELNRLARSINSIDKKLDSIREDVIALKVKAGIWGLVGGIIPATVAIIVSRGN